jgi:hypothetical protein
MKTPHYFFSSPATWMLKTAALLTFFLLLISSIGCFRMKGEAEVLLESLQQSTSLEWDRQIEIRAGVLTLMLARTGLQFVDLDPQARAALKAVRNVQAGVYKTNNTLGSADLSRMMLAADQAMARRGWESIIVVIDQDSLLAVYAPGKWNSSREMNVCLFTFNGRELVIASARSDLQPLLDLAWPR